MRSASTVSLSSAASNALYAPAGTPSAIVERLNREVNAALGQPGVKAAIHTLAAEPSPMTPSQFAAVMREDSRRYGAVIRERQITAT